MPFEFDFNEMYAAAAMYLSKGLRVVRLHGIWPDGRCTCGDPECAVGESSQRSAGKHPRGKSWGDRYARTEDDILAWDDGTPFNIGILLGPGGGVIDNEDDTPEGKAFRENLGLHTLVAPSWTSGRSTHQLTKYDDSLPATGKVEPGGLECRIGGGDTQIQSVVPPSWHWSGVRYAWKPGLSIDEVDVPPTPRELLVQISNYFQGGNGRQKGKPAPRLPQIFGEVHDGQGRHKALLNTSWAKICKHISPLSTLDRAVITKELLDINEKYIKPPKTEQEALKIINSCFEYYRKKKESGWSPTSTDVTEDAIEKEVERIDTVSETATVTVSGFEGHGLQRYYVGEVEAYRPGNWRIQMIHGDPPEVVLCVPAWEPTPCRGRIQMSFDTFRSAPKVASTVFNATRRVILDGDGSKWRSIWKGYEASRKTGGVSVPGLMEQLVLRKNADDDIRVGTSSLRYAQLAGYMMEKIRGAKAYDEDDQTPSQQGRLVWVKPDELWFQWAKVWEDIGRAHDVQHTERGQLRARILDAMGATDFSHRRYRHEKSRMEYIVFTPEWIAAIENLAAGEEGGR